MRRQGLLSWKFNMSLGFIPVIISIVLCLWVSQCIAVWIGAAISLLYSFLYIRFNKRSLPNIILYLSTFILLLVGFASLII